MDYFNFVTNSVKYSLYARNLGNTRANIANPEFFFKESQEIVMQNPEVKINYLKGEELEKEGLHLAYAVGKASKNTPYVINLNY